NQLPYSAPHFSFLLPTKLALSQVHQPLLFVTLFSINKEVMSAENKEIVRKVNSAFEENNMDAVLEQCTDNIKWVMVGNASVEGKEEIRKWMASGNENGNCLSQINSARLVAEGDT